MDVAAVVVVYVVVALDRTLGLRELTIEVSEEEADGGAEKLYRELLPLLLLLLMMLLFLFVLFLLLLFMLLTLLLMFIV